MSNEHSGIVLRERILRELDLTLVRVFDTNEHESHKDVCLVKDGKGQAWVLRTGERRDPTIFPDGYVGKTVVIPRLYRSSEDPLYEIEEYLEGKLVEDADKNSNAAFPDADALNRIFAAFWEWQEVGKRAPLASQETHFEKHLRSALVRIIHDREESVHRVVERNRLFLEDLTHPAKWKFADDNLVLMDNGKLGFIDNARIGLRFWGYDIGWIYWPRWFRLGGDVWTNSDSYIADFQVFLDNWYASKPSYEDLDYSTFSLWSHLGLFTRLVGALYDVEEHAAHAESRLDTEDKRRAFTAFITELLDWNIPHLD